MEDKLINFYIYRYHLLPIERVNTQTNLFETEKYSYQEIKERKNEFFAKVLDGLVESNHNKYPLKLEHSDSDYYLFKLAQKKTTIITQDFKNKIIGNEPFVYIVINNNPSVQKIAISDNIDAFSKPDVVKKILLKSLVGDLEKYRLNIRVEALYNKVEFWNYVDRHKDEITFINFEFVKPNLADISGSLPKVFKNFVNDTNSHESHIVIKAPEKGFLENINESNEEISGLVNYTSEGAGSIKIKAKGLKKQMDTKENPVTFQIRELEIEGVADQVIKAYKAIVE